MIPVQLQTFRLATGAPIVVDYKSHPYKDTEFLEWYERLQLVERCYEGFAEEFPERFAVVVHRFGVSRVVTESSLQLPGTRFETIYQDNYYTAYRVRRPEAEENP
jgi:hypothetical protein